MPKSSKPWAAIALLALAAGIYAMPWKSWLEAELKRQLAQRGLSQLEFSVEALGLHGITLKNVAWDSITLPSVSLNYSPMALLRGQVQDLHAGSIALKQGQIKVHLQGVQLAPAAEDRRGRQSATWQVDSITAQGMPVELPPLEGKGTLEWDGALLHAAGAIQSADDGFHIAFSADHSSADTPRATIRINDARMPWNGGIISTHDVTIPMYSNAPILLKLNIRKVSIHELMRAATGSRASATGTMSGILPVSIERNGQFKLLPGNLQAEDSGTLTLDPGLLPGDSQQVAIVREVLRNFHYSALSLKVDGNKDKKISMLLSLQGNNPDMYNGRRINLNVHLTGDVLEMLTQSVMTINDPQQFLEQEDYAKPEK